MTESPVARYLPASAAAVVLLQPEVWAGTEHASAPLEMFDALAALLPGEAGTDDSWTRALAAGRVAEVIDASGPMGIALVDMRSQTTVVFARVTTSIDARQAVQRLAAADERWQLEQAGRSSIVSAGDAGLGLVLRDTWLFAIRSGAASMRAATETRLAGLSETQALIGHADFRRAVAGLTRRGQGALYLDFEAVFRPLRERIEERQVLAMEQLRDRQERLQQAANPEAATPAWQLQRLRAEVMQARSQLVVIRRQTATELRLVDQLMTAWGQLAASISSAPGEVRAEVAVTPRAGTLASDLLGANRSTTDDSATTSIATRPDDPPGSGRSSLVLSAEPRVLWQTITLLGEALRGFDVERVRAELTGDDADSADPRSPLGLSGRMALVYSASVGWTSAFGFRRPERAHELFQRVAGRLGQAGSVDGRTGLLEVAVAGRALALRLSVADWLLTVSGGRSSGRRQREVSEDLAATRMAQHAGGLSAALTMEELIPLWVEPLLSSSGAEGALAPMPEDDNQDVPFSEAYLELLAEYGAIVERALADTAEVAALARDRDRDLGRHLGQLRLSITRADGGLRGQVSWRLRAAEGIELLRLWRAHGDQRQEVHREWRERQQERRIRARELRRWLLQVRARDVQDWDMSH